MQLKCLSGLAKNMGGCWTLKYPIPVDLDFFFSIEFLLCLCVEMISLQIAWQSNTIVPGHWCLEYKKHSNENLFDLAQKELHGREYPPLALWSECQRHDFWTRSVWKTSTARGSELLFGQILHSSLQWILKIWCRCNKCLTFSLFLTLEGRWRWPVTFQLVIQVVSDVGQV